MQKNNLEAYSGIHSVKRFLFETKKICPEGRFIEQAFIYI